MIDGMVTVVIPTRNRVGFLKQAVASVFAQSYPNWELIVIDDGSATPVTDAVIHNIEDARLIRFDESKGASKARNAGIDLARGEYIAFLDDDDIWLRDKLALQVQVLKEKPQVGLVGGGCEYIDENGNPILKPKIRSEIVTNRELSISVSLPGATSNSMFRVSCLHEVGKFNEALHRAEDWELFLRISEHFEVRAVPHVTVKMRTHTGFRRPTSAAEIIASRKALHSRIPSYRVRRQALAMTYWRVSDLAAKDGQSFTSSYYLLRSLIAWPLPVRYGGKRLRPFLSNWKARLGAIGAKYS